MDPTTNHRHLTSTTRGGGGCGTDEGSFCGLFDISRSFL
jgi:hypothetical protein